MENREVHMSATQHTISQATLSESNRSHVLRYLYLNGVSSRAQIARALGLTPAAITKITARLLGDGIIAETHMTPGNPNHRSIGLKLLTDRFHVVGVKFARSLLEIGTFDLNGTQLTLVDLPTVSNDTIDEALKGVHETVVDLIEGDPKVIAVGMAVPGPYLRDAGHTAIVSSMNNWHEVDFPKEFGSSFTVPVFIEQDARAGALAEQLFSVKRNISSLAYYLLGEGVGLGVIEDGRLVSGALGTAAELGHISIDVNGRACDCGNVGCLEQYCSAVAVHRMMDEAHYCSGVESMTHREACERLFSDSTVGVAEATRMVCEIGRYVGYGCAIIINAFNPGQIILGDILAKAGPLLLKAVRDVVHERVIPEIADATEITLSDLPTDAAVSGAAAIAITEFLNHPSRFLHNAKAPPQDEKAPLDSVRSEPTESPPAAMTA